MIPRSRATATKTALSRDGSGAVRMRCHRLVRLATENALSMRAGTSPAYASCHAAT